METLNAAQEYGAFDNVQFAAKEWQDTASYGTPITAQDLNRIEQAIQSLNDRMSASGPVKQIPFAAMTHQNLLSHSLFINVYECSAGVVLTCNWSEAFSVSANQDFVSATATLDFDFPSTKQMFRGAISGTRVGVYVRKSGEKELTFTFEQGLSINAWSTTISLFVPVNWIYQ